MRETEMPADAETITLGDGRTLGYAEYGDPEGKPLFHFHGHPGSRLEAALLHEPAAAAGIRLIGTDRPGMGLSEHRRDRRILDWPDDIGELADALGLGRFSVQGISGGGPYAAACAYGLPERLTGCALISSAGPTGLGLAQAEMSINRLQRRLARFAPWSLDLAFAWLARSVKARGKKAGPDGLAAAALGNFPRVDREAMADPLRRRRYGLSLLEAFRKGSRGPAREARLLFRPWGFRLEEIRADYVHVWQGGLDRNVSPETGPAMAEAIPGSRGHFHRDDGHLSIAFNHVAEILEAMGA